MRFGQEWTAHELRAIVGAAAAVTIVMVLTRPAGAQTAAPRIEELSLEELSNLEVTSVSRRPQSLAEAPAAIFVITAEDIRRAGVTSLAEALRIAPNLQVARLDASQYAISARGFNGLAANKLLVLVDGRTIYTPLFSGVFWDQQDVLIEDIERIEVISGPGATLWGANAVNGVINVITRSARDTTGVVATIGGGPRQQIGAVRYGGQVGASGHFRVYGKFTELENSRRADGVRVPDGRHWFQTGFRADWGDASGGFTLQGETYGAQSVDRGSAAGIAIGRAELTGHNLAGNWTHQLRDGSDLRVHAYVDHSRRREQILFQPISDLFDVELQHGMSKGLHRVIWGTGYRHGRDDVDDGFLVGFRPTKRALDWFNVYVQDSARLNDRLNATAGIRFERNDYTGWEQQYNARLSWHPLPEHALWGGVSRAVRAPARFDRDVIRPLGGVFGGPDFESEVADVFQVGYRGRAASAFTWSVATFLHQWDKLRSASAPPVVIENKIEGPVYGVEAWASWQLLSAWRMSGGLTALQKDLRLKPDSTDLIGTDNPQLSNDPGHQTMLRSSLTLWADHDIDVIARHVADLPHPVVPAYTAVDMRYAWRIRPGLELSVLGQNLFDRSHPEFNAAPGRSEIERGAFVHARWSQ